MKAILELSGDQANGPTSKDSVTRWRPVPSGWTASIAETTPVLSTNAIQVPSGDQFGLAPGAICTGAEPSSRAEKSCQRALGSAREDPYTSCGPAGDHTGASFRRPSVVIRLTSPPAALAV